MYVKEELNNIAQALSGAPEVSTKQVTDKNSGKSKVKLNVSERSDFDGLLKTKITTTQDLCREVNDFFSQALGDYEGCMIDPDMNNLGAFTLKIYLSDKGDVNSDTKVKCLERIGAKQTNSLYDRLSNFNIAQTSKFYTLTEDAKSVLEDFVTTFNNNKVDWSRTAVEFTDNSAFGAGQKIYTVVHLDLKKVVKKMYGNKLPTGGYADYLITNIRPLAPANMMTSMMAMASNFMISIAQLDSKQVEEICTKLGMAPQSAAGFAMVRA